MKKFNKLWVLLLTLSMPIALVARAGECAPAKKEAYPKKRIEFVVPYPPGGITDLTARALASVLPEFLGQPVVVINKAGGARLEGGEYVSSRKPDGYTLMIAPPSVGWPEIHFKDPPYKSSDLVPVCQIIGIRMTLVVAAGSKYTSLKDIEKDLESNPSLKVQMGNTGAGAMPHMVAAGFAAYINKKDQLISIPFGGDAGAVTALLGKHIPLVSMTGTGIVGQVQAGTVRVLGITGEKRWNKLPDVPTLDELGYKLGFGIGENTLYAPKGTPKEVIQILNEAIVKAIEHKSFIALVDKAGIPVEYQSHEEYMKTFEAKKATVGRINKELGLLK